MIIKVKTPIFCENFMSTETFTYCYTYQTLICDTCYFQINKILSGTGDYLACQDKNSDDPDLFTSKGRRSLVHLIEQCNCNGFAHIKYHTNASM